jgi:hypothetical protein
MPNPVPLRPHGRRPTMLEMSARLGAHADPQRAASAGRVIPLRPALPILPRPGMPLPMRRFLDISEAAEYVGVGVDTFRKEVEAGMWPPPVRRGRTGRAVTWDVRALDAAADRMAGIEHAAAVVADAETSKRAASAALMARLK